MVFWRLLLQSCLYETTGNTFCCSSDHPNFHSLASSGQRLPSAFSSRASNPPSVPSHADTHSRQPFPSPLRTDLPSSLPLLPAGRCPGITLQSIPHFQDEKSKNQLWSQAWKSLTSPQPVFQLDFKGSSCTECLIREQAVLLPVMDVPLQPEISVLWPESSPPCHKPHAGDSALISFNYLPARAVLALSVHTEQQGQRP